MAKYEFDGSVSASAPRDSDGHFMRVLKDGVKVFGGAWGDCANYILFHGNDEDLYCDHTDGAHMVLTIGELKRRRSSEPQDDLMPTPDWIVG